MITISRYFCSYYWNVVCSLTAFYRSWLGFEKNLAVNCNGYVSEGVYPED
jgi:hypothetical protein